VSFGIGAVASVAHIPPSILRILANDRHVVDPDGGGLLSLMQCFPNLEKLSISWSISRRRPLFSLKPTRGTFDGLPHLRRLEILLHPPLDVSWNDSAQQELLSLFTHLPLCQLESVGVFFEDLMSSEAMDMYIVPMTLAMRTMRFPNLNLFHIGFNMEVNGQPEHTLLVSWVRRSVTLLAYRML
jgi:hypothetical protein